MKWLDYRSCPVNPDVIRLKSAYSLGTWKLKMNEIVASTCQLFLVPAAILFGALGVATTEQLKTLVSIMGLITSGLWAARIWLLVPATTNTLPLDGIPVIDIRFGLALAIIFVLAYTVSTFAHCKAWYKQRNTNRPTA